jgi:tRNA(Ile)-lysidine synthase
MTRTGPWPGMGEFISTAAIAGTGVRVLGSKCLAVAQVDQGLSEHSQRVAARVASDAASAGYDAHVIRLAGLEGPNLHARARAHRYGFFEELARRLGATRIATGHTLDDRVETTLARLVHGGATQALAGLPPSEGSRIRPLVEVRRSETRAYCEQRSLEFFDDPANEDPRFERVAVRRLLVAAIEERWGDGGVRAIARSAERLREDAAALTALADRIYPDVARRTEEGLRIEIDALTSMPRALRRRILERAVGRVRDRSGGIDAALAALERPSRKAAHFDVAGGIAITLGPAHLLVTMPGDDGSA